MSRKSEGFTLVELMVVVLIIGILVAIAIPVFSAAKSNAQEKSCWANQRTLEGSAQQYAARNDGALPATVAALIPNYIKVEPKCPQADATGYGFDADGIISTRPIGCTHGHF